MKDNYRCMCDDCLKTGGQTFARLFYKKINNKWIYLCSVCWNKVLTNKTKQT